MGGERSEGVKVRVGGGRGIVRGRGSEGGVRGERSEGVKVRVGGGRERERGEGLGGGVERREGYSKGER